MTAPYDGPRIALDGSGHVLVHSRCAAPQLQLELLPVSALWLTRGGSLPYSSAAARCEGSCLHPWHSKLLIATPPRCWTGQADMARTIRAPACTIEPGAKILVFSYCRGSRRTRRARSTKGHGSPGKRRTAQVARVSRDTALASMTITDYSARWKPAIDTSASRFTYSLVAAIMMAPDSGNHS